MKTNRPKLREKPAPAESLNDVELAHLEHKLKINKHALDDEVCEQPDHLFDSGEAVALLESRRDEAKDKLKTVEAELFIDLMAEQQESGEKATEKVINALVQKHERRAKAFAKLITAEREFATAKNLRESFKDRGYMIKGLCELYTTDYFTSHSSTSGKAVAQVRENEYDKRREQRLQERRKRR